MEDSPPPPAPGPPELPSGHPASIPGCRFNPALFFGFLLGPPVLTLMGIVFLGSDTGLAVGMIVALAGSLIGGIVCGIHFARVQRTLSTGAKVGVGIALAVGCAAASFALCFGGCLLGAGMAGNFRH